MKMFVLLSCTVALCIAYVDSLPTFVVESPFGSIKGLEVTANNSKLYLAFRGIPYAKPPEGELRFAKPVQHPKLDGVFDASKFGNSCIQAAYMLAPEETMSENCLFLNVYVKSIPTQNRPQNLKKVMVWIHGGGFILGSSFAYDAGSFVTNNDVIVVTINYRLGVLGFLSTEDEASPGNYGLWDQIMALKWVKVNIASFGGDPNDITIGGQSAGGASVSLLSLTPFAKGYFTKVYAQSGSATSLFAKYINAKLDAIKLSQSMNCSNGNESTDSSDSHKIIECLKERSVVDISMGTNFQLSRTTFIPRVDGQLFPRSPAELLKDDPYLDSIGFFQRKYLVSFNNNEKQTIDTLYTTLKSFALNRPNATDADKMKEWSQLLTTSNSVNIGDRLGVEGPPSNVVSAVSDWYQRRFDADEVLPKLNCDLFFYIPAFDFLDALARSRSTDSWLLYFNHFPGYMKGGHKGIVHGVDMVYWFDIALEGMARVTNAGIQGGFGQEDDDLKEMFSSLIAEFVNNGNPSRALAGKLPNGWPPYDVRGAYYLDFNPRPSVQRNLMREQRDLWLKRVPRLMDRVQGCGQHDLDLW